MVYKKCWGEGINMDIKSRLFNEDKIIYITSIDVSMGNGPGVNEREFIISVSKLMHDRIMFVIPKPKYKIDDLDFPHDKCAYSFRWSRGDKLRFIPHTISQIKVFNKVYKRFAPDLIVMRLSGLPISQYYLAKRYRFKYALKTIGPNLLKAFSNKSKVLEYINKIIITELINNSSFCDAVSDNHIQRLKSVFPNINILKVDNSVNINRFYKMNQEEVKNKLGLAEYKYIVGYAGNFPFLRGGEQLVRVAEKLVKKYNSIGFVILGGDDNLNKLKDLAKELGVFDKFVFTGKVPFDDVSMWINTFDIGVSFLKPEHSGASEQKVRQYLACGKPVVCSTGSSNFIEENALGFNVAWDDLQDIYNKIVYLLDLPEEKKNKISNECRNYAEEILVVDTSTKNRLEFWRKELI